MLQNLNFSQLRTSIAGLGKDKKDFKTLKTDRLAVITSSREASIIPKEILEYFKDYRPTLITPTHLKIGSFDVIIKQQKHQRATVARSISNEHNFVEYVNQAIKDNGEPLTINFAARGKTAKFDNIKEASHVGSTGIFQGNKADVLLWTKSNQKIPISLKQDNATFWGSPDSELKSIGEKFYTFAIKNNHTRILNPGETAANKSKRGRPASTNVAKDVVKIDPFIGFKLTQHLGTFVVFGNDINNKGVVLIKTWTPSDFILDPTKDNVLDIKSNYLYKTFADLDGDHIPYFVMINDSSRRIASNIIPPGIRFLITQGKWAKTYTKIINFSS